MSRPQEPLKRRATPLPAGQFSQPAIPPREQDQAASGGRRAAPPTSPRPAGTSGEIRVQKGIPIPLRKRFIRQSRYPFLSMAIDESFFIPGRKQISIPASVRSTTRKFVQRGTTENGVPGVRVWRRS